MKKVSVDANKVIDHLTKRIATLEREIAILIAENEELKERNED